MPEIFDDFFFRQGFYMIGNMDLLSSVSSTWRTIQQKLMKNGNIGPVLKLTCDKHVPIVGTKIRTILDFRNALHTPCPECSSRQKASKCIQNASKSRRKAAKSLKKLK